MLFHPLSKSKLHFGFLKSRPGDRQLGSECIWRHPQEALGGVGTGTRREETQEAVNAQVTAHCSRVPLNTCTDDIRKPYPSGWETKCLSISSSPWGHLCRGSNCPDFWFVLRKSSAGDSGGGGSHRGIWGLSPQAQGPQDGINSILNASCEPPALPFSVAGLEKN